MGPFARTLHRLRRPDRSTGADGPSKGVLTVIDGASAVAELEPQRGQPGGALAVVRGRSGLATAMGLAQTGVRASAFLTGPDLLASLDLVQQAVARALPLVIHHATRSTAGAGVTLGTGHEPHHAAADTGAVLLFARNIQEAVDLGLVARRVTETTRVPVVVTIDGDPTASSVEEVRLPSSSMCRDLLGAPNDLVRAASPAHALLFGPEHRRVSRSHDLDAPTLTGPHLGPEVAGLATASRRAFLAANVPGALADSLAAVSRATGRRLDLLATHRVDDAEILLVAQGAAAEMVEAMADHLRTTMKLRVGAVGIRCLRPFPEEALTTILRGRRAVLILERVDVPLAGDPPLTRELRGVVERALAVASPHRWREKDRPHIHTAIAGVGGSPLRPADLQAACREVAVGVAEPLLLLGVDVGRATKTYPKRQVRAEAILRAVPTLDALCVRAPDEKTPPIDLRGPGAFTLAVLRAPGDAGPSLAAHVAALLVPVLGGRVRSRLAQPSAPWMGTGTDLVSFGSETLVDPGDRPPVDLLVATARTVRTVRIDPSHRPRALLLLGDGVGPEDLPAPARDLLRAHAVPVLAAGVDDEAGALGALVASLQTLDLTVSLPRLIRTLVDAEGDPSGEAADALAGAFEAGHAAVRSVDLPDAADAPPEGDAPGAPVGDARGAPEGDAPGADVPLAVRHLTRTDDAHDSLPRFWDQIGVLYRDGAESALGLDPVLALGTVPPLTAVLRDLSRATDAIPEFDPTACTGCGQCWTVCPEGAVVPVVLAPAPLLDHGMALAKRRGHDVSALGMIVSKLGPRMGRLMAGEDAPTNAGDLLRLAFDGLLEKIAPDEARRLALTAAMEAVIETVGALPLAATAPFYEPLEAEGSGRGELLAITIDPTACKACGLCTAVCTPGALPVRDRTPDALATARSRRRVAEEMPDVPGTTITRVASDPRVGPAAATLLSRHARATFSGGDGAEAGSGEKIALRLVLAAIEVERQPMVAAHLAEIETLRDALASAIRDLLAGALPTGDLDALAKGLEGLDATDVDLAALTARVDHATGHGTVDRDRLGRLVALAKSMADLHWTVSRGVNGFGRARASLAVADGPVAAWVGTFPLNPFAIPVAVDAAGEGVALARGLLEGHLRRALDDVRMLRRARLELEHPIEAPYLAAKLDDLDWPDLTEVEQRSVAPLLLVGDDRSLGGQALGAMAPLLAGDLPLKVLVLGGGDLGLPGDMSSGDPGHGGAHGHPEPGLLALAARNAFVLQGSVGALDHLARGVRDAMRLTGPALLHVHTPSPTRHGFASDETVARAEAAVRCRVAPLFRYDPTGPGVFGSRLDLTGNPAVDERCLREEGTEWTPVHWALGEGRYRDEVPSGDVAGASPRLRRASDARLDRWRVLQELAGVVTPFTASVRSSAEREVAEAHAAELTALRREHEAEILRLSDEVREEMAARLRARLLALSAAGRKRVPETAGTGEGAS